jgi:hypothetical protein
MNWEPVVWVLIIAVMIGIGWFILTDKPSAPKVEIAGNSVTLTRVGNIGDQEIFKGTVDGKTCYFMEVMGHGGYTITCP